MSNTNSNLKLNKCNIYLKEKQSKHTYIIYFNFKILLHYRLVFIFIIVSQYSLPLDYFRDTLYVTNLAKLFLFLHICITTEIVTAEK